MRSLTRIAIVLALSAGLVLTGCSKAGSDGKAPGKDTLPTQASAEDTRATAGDYSGLRAESDNEKQSVANVDKALKSQIASSKDANAQNGSETYVFDNAEGYKPTFVGYQVTLFSGKKANGKYSTCTLAVLGDGKVTADSVWDREQGVTRENGMLGETFFNIESEYDSEQFVRTFEPASTGEKRAVELAQAWMKENVSDIGYKRAKLTGYYFAYGQPEDQPSMIMAVAPDGTAMGSVVDWPEDYNK